MRVILLILLTSCATGPDIDTSEYKYMPSHVVKYVLPFEKKYGKSLKDVNIIMYKYPKKYKKAAGSCNMISRQIKLNKQIWPHISEEKKYTIVWHELGHCVLGLSHSSSNFIGCPTSLMHYKAVSDKCFKRHRKKYLNELFKRESSNWGPIGEGL
jgi:hypothetical protein